MRRFDLFILSLTAPEEGNVLWIDTSLDPPTIKVFTNGEWEPVVVNGKSAYELYLDVTADNPPLTLEQFTLVSTNTASILNEQYAGKEAIADAIILKGGMASEVASFAELADNINDIPNFNAYGTTWQTGYEPTSAIEVFNNKTLYLTEINNTIAQTIETYAFAYCSNVTTVSLPVAQTIGGYAFAYCSNVTTVSLPVAQTIGDRAFISCSNLTTASLPVAQTIATYAFAYCSSLTTITFGKLTSFSSNNTFTGCFRLSNIIIGVDTNINLDFSSLSHATWNANIDASVWNDNFVSGIINNLFDFTSGGAHTIKLGAYPYAKLTPETIALAAAKNWNITS